MKSTRIPGLILSVLMAAACVLYASAAAASTTENECINGGGYVSEGSGCRFCIGGKFDLTEVNFSSKERTAYSKQEQKAGQRDSSLTGADNTSQDGR